MDLALLDSSVIFGATNTRDLDHVRCRDLLSGGQYGLVVPGLCIAEVAHLIGRDLGPLVEARFVLSLPALDVRSPTPEDWPRIAELVRQYADFPLGTVDASVVALAERLDVRTIMTLDRRHFGAVRPAHVPAFELLP